VESIRARNRKRLRVLDHEALARFSDDYIKRVFDPGEKFWLPKFIKLLIAQRNAMQDHVDRWEKLHEKAMVVVAKATVNAGQFLLDISGEMERLTELYSELLGVQLASDYDKLKEELPVSKWPAVARVQWNVTDHTIHQYVAVRRAELQQITTTTMEKARDKINDATDEAIRDGLTVQQTARKIKDAIADAIEIRQHQARTIARTEVGSISSKARYGMFKNVGVEYHEWVTANDEKVRDTHDAVNGKVRRIGEEFGKTGLAFPLDPEGDAAEVINCRCVTIAVPGDKDDEDDEDNTND
jgi:SPP1 gp7 family putative phage head morphogenesis protein